MSDNEHLRSTIKSMVSQGMSQSQIAAALNSQSLKTARKGLVGRFDQPTISRLLKKWNLKTKVVKGVKRAKSK